MLPSPAPTVKPATSQWLPKLMKEQAIIWLACGVPALLICLMGLDFPIATAIYQPAPTQLVYKLSTFLRHYGTLPGTLLTIAGLAALFWPRLRSRHPNFYFTALVVTFTAIFGVGLLNQVLVKSLANRPRPTESALNLAPLPTTDGFHGNSMPSGHAAMGFLLAAPFFTLRRRGRPGLAAASLALGLATGTLVGLSRMALGAHFATDVLLAATLTFASASAFTLLFTRIPRVNPAFVACVTLAFALAVILGNRFTGQELTLNIVGPFHSIALPCPVETVPTLPGAPQRLTVTLSGYGAPISNLKLVNNQGFIKIQRTYGLYHRLSCTASLSLPTE